MMKPIPIQRVLARNCVKLRADLSQSDVATRAARSGFKIDQKTISRLENPESSNSTVKTIEAVAAALGVSAWKLLMPEGVAQIPSSNTKAQAIIEIINTLNDEGLTALLSQAEFLSATDKYHAHRKQQRS